MPATRIRRPLGCTPSPGAREELIHVEAPQKRGRVSAVNPDLLAASLQGTLAELARMMSGNANAHFNWSRGTSAALRTASSADWNRALTRPGLQPDHPGVFFHTALLDTNSRSARAALPW